MSGCRAMLFVPFPSRTILCLCNPVDPRRNQRDSLCSLHFYSESAFALEGTDLSDMVFPGTSMFRVIMEIKILALCKALKLIKESLTNEITRLLY